MKAIHFITFFIFLNWNFLIKFYEFRPFVLLFIAGLILKEKRRGYGLILVRFYLFLLAERRSDTRGIGVQKTLYLIGKEPVEKIRYSAIYRQGGVSVVAQYSRGEKFNYYKTPSLAEQNEKTPPAGNHKYFPS